MADASFLTKWERVIKAMPSGVARVRHVKRGSEYEIVGQAMLQTSKPLTDMETMVVYRGDDGVLWVRPASEFEDGRFVPSETKKTAPLPKE